MNNQLLEEIKYSYGKNEPVSESLIESFFSSNDEVVQEILVKTILNDAHLKRYSASRKYRLSFWKKIIDLLERRGSEVNELIYSDYLAVLNEPKDPKELFFTTYYSQDRKPIVLEQCASIISGGTTGLHVWPACKCLIEFLESQSSLVKSKNVLELGAGVGLLGLSCLVSTSQPNHFIFTDSHHLVLDQIGKNLGYNEISTNDFTLSKLDWSEPITESDLLTNPHFSNLDLILASDIVFDPELIEPLVNTLESIWSCQLGPSKLTAYISSTIRNTDTYNFYLNQLNKRDFKYETVLRETTRNKVGPDCSIEILKISK